MKNPTTPADDDMEYPDYNEDLFLQENWPETDSEPPEYPEDDWGSQGYDPTTEW